MGHTVLALVLKVEQVFCDSGDNNPGSGEGGVFLEQVVREVVPDYFTL